MADGDGDGDGPSPDPFGPLSSGTEQETAPPLALQLGSPGVPGSGCLGGALGAPAAWDPAAAAADGTCSPCARGAQMGTADPAPDGGQGETAQDSATNGSNEVSGELCWELPVFDAMEKVPTVDEDIGMMWRLLLVLPTVVCPNGEWIQDCHPPGGFLNFLNKTHHALHHLLSNGSSSE